MSESPADPAPAAAHEAAAAAVADPALFEGLTTIRQFAERVATIPSNHSPEFAPVPDPTLELGVAALTAATRHWLPVAGA